MPSLKLIPTALLAMLAIVNGKQKRQSASTMARHIKVFLFV